VNFTGNSVSLRISWKFHTPYWPLIQGVMQPFVTVLTSNVQKICLHLSVVSYERIYEV